MKPWILAVCLLLPAAALAQEPGDPPTIVEIPRGDLVYTASLRWDTGPDEEGLLTLDQGEEGPILRSMTPDAPARFAPGTQYVARDFYAEVAFTAQQCANESSALLLNVRSDPASPSPTSATAYVFVYQCDGAYRSRPVDAGTSGPVEISGASGIPLLPDTQVVMGVLLIGDEISWFLNGQFLGNATTQMAPRTGQFALGVQLGLEVEINSLQVWSIAPTALPHSFNSPLNETTVGETLYREDYESPGQTLITGAPAALPGVIEGSALVVSSADPVALYYRADAPSLSIPLYYAEVVFDLRECGQGGGFGLVFGPDTANFYALVLECSGRFVTRDYNTSAPGTINLQRSADIVLNADELYKIGAVINGNTMYIYFEGGFIGSLDIPNANQRQIGLVWLAAENDPTEVGIHHFQVVELLEP